MTSCVLKDLIEISKDGEWGKGEPFDDSVEMLAIRGTDFEGARFGVLDSVPRRNVAKRIAERKTLKPWDLLIEAAGGTKNQITGRTVLLRPQLFERSELPITCASFSRFIRFRRDNCDAEFMFWYLQYLYGAGFMHAYHTQHTGVSRFQWTTFSEREPLTLPPLSVQRRIAGVLSAYDELIENNQRRVRILEEMARALYREWFVNFRVPGHEKVKLVPSALGPVPQGWEVKEMRHIAEVIDCLHSKKPAEDPDGPGILLQLNNIGEGGKLDMRETFRISAENYALWTSRIELRYGDCIITNVGRVAAVAQIPEGVRAAPGRNMTAVRPRVGCLTPTFLLEYLLSPHMASEVGKKKDLGTIMDSLNVKGIVRLNVPCPPMALMERFEQAVQPIRRRIELLIQQSENLRCTRDLLLPRLLAGQLQLVSNM